MQQLTRQQAINIMRRFAGLPTASGISRKVLVNELVDAMIAHARSEAHAARVVQALLESCTFLPGVSALVDQCEHTPDDQKILATRKDCRHCQGDGWVTMDGPYGISAAYPCDHSGIPNERYGITIPASLQNQYSMEQVEAAGRRLAGLPARHGGSGGSQGAESAIKRLIEAENGAG